MIQRIDSVLQVNSKSSQLLGDGINTNGNSAGCLENFEAVFPSGVATDFLDALETRNFLITLTDWDLPMVKRT